LDNGLCLVTGKERRNRSLPFVGDQTRAAPNFPPDPSSRSFAIQSAPQLPLAASLHGLFFVLGGSIGVEQQTSACYATPTSPLSMLFANNLMLRNPSELD